MSSYLRDCSLDIARFTYTDFSFSADIYFDLTNQRYLLVFESRYEQFEGYGDSGLSQ